MISKQVKDKLRGIIEEYMIPEYKKLMDLRKKLQKELEDYSESDFLSPRDLELISKYPRCIILVEHVTLCDYYSPGDKKYGWENFKSLNISYQFQFDLLTLRFSKSVPSICGRRNLLDLREEKDNQVWKKFGNDLLRYMKFKDIYLQKLDITYKFLNHKNTTLALIRENFPELYSLYKDENNDRD